MIEEKVIVDGEMLEKSTYFYRNGVIAEVKHRKEGKLHGICKGFNKEGDTLYVARLKEGKYNGRYTWTREGTSAKRVYFYINDKDITSEVVEFLEENPPKNELYPSYVEGYFRLKYGLSLEELDIKVEEPS